MCTMRWSSGSLSLVTQRAIKHIRMGTHPGATAKTTLSMLFWARNSAAFLSDASSPTVMARAAKEEA